MGETLEQVQELKRYVQKTYEGLGLDVLPIYPYVLLRVIPKEQEIGLGAGRRLFTPQRVNKTVFEGQIIKTYRPGNVVTKRCEKCGTVAGRMSWRESSLKPGQHVLFAHYVGIPVEQLCYYWKAGEYRLVEEGAILGVVEYEDKTDEEKLREILDKRFPNASRYDIEKAVQDVLSQSTVVFSQKAKTMSGV